MITLYKLTNENDQTYDGCQWGKNITVKTSGEGELCGPGWTHWYTDPLLAVLLNPIHGNFDLSTAHLWEGEGEVVLEDGGLKVGCKVATTMRRIKMPVISVKQRIRFGILCALAVSSAASAAASAAECAVECAASRVAEYAAASAAEYAARAANIDLMSLAKKAMKEEETAICAHCRTTCERAGKGRR